MHYRSPLGRIWIEADEIGLTHLTFSLEEKKAPEKNYSSQAQAHLTQTIFELDEFFQGERRQFTVPLHTTKGTAFQKKVWQALQTIPYGKSKNYQEIAQWVNSPLAVRAVGQANKANPIAIIIPCHRVIGKNGTLTGYMGSGELGLQIKKELLILEKNYSDKEIDYN